MTRFFPKLYLDLSSFWAGIILVVLLLVLFFVYRKRLKSFLTRILTNIVQFRESLTVASDDDYIQVLYKYTQGLHICCDYFPLDSILIPASFIAPPAYFFPGSTSLDTSLIQQVLGYDPVLPELSSEFFGPTFPLIDAVQSGTDLCLLGYPGTGKTTAIAECITGLLKPVNNDGDDEIQPAPRMPFYVHARHILAQFPERDLLSVLIKGLQLNKNFLVIPNFPAYITTAIKSNQAVLFIDDMDGLALEDINRLSNFINALKKQFPDLQIVATASPTCLGNLVMAPLEFISISPWGNQEKYAFLEKLSNIWPALQPVESQQNQDSLPLVNDMLVVSGHNLSPFEFTLKSIAAYAGDLGGPSAVHALEAYLEREPLLGEGSLNTLTLIAVYCLERNQSSFSRRDLSAWFEDVYKTNSSKQAVQKFAPFQAVIQSAVDAKILAPTYDHSYHFIHPAIAGFLGAKGLTGVNRNFILGILEKPDSGPNHQCMHYFAAFNDIKPFLKPLLSDKSLFKYKLLRASQWLAYIPLGSPEETALFKQITRQIQNSSPYLIKVRLIVALSKSKNPQINKIFQHLLKSRELEIRRAAAIGEGLIYDLQAVPHLIQQLNDSFPSSTAACYALGKIGSPRSLEAIAEALLHGSEMLRRAAAEALAQNRSEGHPALREGSTLEDILVRHAVVHGLSLINEPWSLEILNNMRIDENEWVVRDLAQQSYHNMVSTSPYLPQNRPLPQKASWLHKFADDQEIPRPTAENALDYLLKALGTGTDEQKQYALAHLARSGKNNLVPAVLEIANNEKFDIAHQAMLTAWFCAPPRYKIHN